MASTNASAALANYSQRLVEAGNQGGALQAIIAEDFNQTKNLSAENAQLRKWFEQGALTGLDAEARRLNESWSKFLLKLPNEEKAALEESQEPLSIDGVVKVIENIRVGWQTSRRSGKAGAVNAWWKRCCFQLKSHHTLLGIIPEGSHYTSLFAGVLKSVIYATVNYENVATYLAGAVEEINSLARQCADVQSVYDTKRMELAICDLYGRIFDFFTEILTWYMDKKYRRVLGSFNEDLQSRFDVSMDDIRKVAKAISTDQWQLGLAAELRVARQGVDRLETFVKSFAQKTQMSSEEQARRQQELGTHIAAVVSGQLREQFEQARRLIAEDVRNQLLIANVPHTAPALQSNTHLTADSSVEHLKMPITGSAGCVRLRQDEIQARSRNLSRYYSQDRIRIRFDPASVLVPAEANVPLQSWIASSHSALLSISGPDEQVLSGPTAMSGIAASIVNFAALTKIPVISYFCELERHTPIAAGETRQSQAMIAVVYALLHQLGEWLPLDAEYAIDLSESRFASLHGTKSSLDEALRCLDEVLEYGPDLLYCIVDGFQLLETQSLQNQLDDFVRVLRRRDASRVTLKVLITTSGRSRCLSRNLARNELVQVEGQMRNSRVVATGRPMMLPR